MKTIEELKQHPQWVGWKIIQRPKSDGELVNVKLPINPNTGKAASSTAPETWATAAQAWASKKRYRLAGIGYVFTLSAGVVGVDLDHCFEDGQIRPYALEIVTALNSYTEYSPSGNGLHILVCGTIPHSITNKEQGIEIYNQGRYFTVTGKQYQSTGYIADRQEALQAVWLWGGGDFNEPPPLPDVQSPRQDVTPDEVRTMLNCIPPNGDYQTHWLTVLMAVHSQFPNEQGIELCEQWSPGYKGEIRHKFNSFKRDSGVTIATLIHKAKEYGYKKAQSWNTNTPRQTAANDLRAML